MQAIVRTLAALALVSLLGACAHPVPPWPASGGTWRDASIRVQEGERWYRLYLPRDLPEGAPAVILLHGGTQSMRKIFAERAGGTRAWPLLADTERFLLVAPNGTDPYTGATDGDSQNWSDDRAGTTRRIAHADDIAFLRRLVAHVVATHRIDPSRVYVTGASNGGMMTYRVLREMPDAVAAGAAFIANLPVGASPLAPPARPVPLMIVNGTKDALVKWEGGPIGRDRGQVRSAQETVEWWIVANRASVASARTRVLEDRDPTDGCRIHETVYPAGRDGAEVWFLRAEGGGHTMPSRNHPLPNLRLIERLLGTVCRDAEGAELAWAFFRRHRRGEL